MEKGPILQLTPSAVHRVKALLARADQPATGLRVGVKTTGCSGYQYVVEYADGAKPMEDVVEQDGVTVYVDPVATLYLVGSVMDYQDSLTQAGFTFDNPNAKNLCGCGESFSV